MIYQGERLMLKPKMTKENFNVFLEQKQTKTLIIP
jgi:hypothetical protein